MFAGSIFGCFCLPGGVFGVCVFAGNVFAGSVFAGSV